MLVAIAACSKHEDAPPAPTATAVEVAPPPPADAADTTAGKFKITFQKARTPGSELGKRCTIAGDPLAVGCMGSVSVALDGAGTLWVVSGKQVRRLKGDGCAYTEAGAPVDLPADNPRPQPLGKGKVYMRSGGAEWKLLADGNKVYAYDYLGGMFRIDSGKAEPFCDVFGYDSAVAIGGKIVVGREGAEELKPGKTCTTVKRDDKLKGRVGVANGKLVEVSRDNALSIDGKALETDHLCSTGPVFACGGGVCVVDGNCRGIVQADPPRKLDYDQLFAPQPWSISGVVTKPDGTAIVGAVLREGQGDAATCEGAVFELPAAVFNR